MKVVIVAKTRMGSAACIGGLTFAGESVRLIAADRDNNDHAGMEYEVGDVWDVQATPDPVLIPPHIENIIVHEKRRLPALDDLPAFVRQHMPPRVGGLEELFEGLTQANRQGSLYIANQTGLPSFSTMFWQPDQPLAMDVEGKRIRYCYPAGDGGKKLTFVGFQEPLPELPTGTLLRVSLAHWWRPTDRPDKELRCYVQLSGWLFPQQMYWPAPYLDLDEEPYFDPATLPEPAPPPMSAPLPEPTRYTFGRPESPADKPALEDAYVTLSKVFGFDSFRPLQEEIISRLLEGQDTIAIMPTGSGKSLCYQLPALLFPGLTVVVSPLIALMQDQVDALRQMAIPANFLNSTLSYSEYLDVKSQVLAGRIKLLYVAPETLLRPETLAMLDMCRVECLTVDEAHCISEWGHDFRPEYRQLLNVRRRYPKAVCLALTATATPRVQQDIAGSLRMAQAEMFIASFDRPNLFLSASSRTDETRQIMSFLEGRKGQAGIIYCPTRQGVDDTAAFLQSRGWEALPYHAGLADDVRRANQRRFIHGDGVIVVATIAFGMGIDKPDVRFVLHLGLPKDLESYYQQIGRAGRDGLPADCLLLHSSADSITNSYFIRQQAEDQQAGARQRLNQMVSFAETGQCRRVPLLLYFGETPDSDSCDNCDNCREREQGELIDVSVPAQKFLSCVKRTGERFGAAHVINVLRGSRAEAVLKWKHDQLSTYGIGRELSAREWRGLADQFVVQGLLARDPEHGTLRLTPAAYEVLKGKPVSVYTPREEKTVRVREREALEYDSELFEILRERRRELADEADLPPYAIFPDRTLMEMSVYYPQSAEELSALYGVGQYKLDRYGAIFVTLIREYCLPRQIAPKQKHRPRRDADEPVSPRTIKYVQLYEQGQAIDVIAADNGVTRQTVVTHLWRYAKAGYRVRADGLRELLALSPADEQRARAALDELGADSLGPTYWNLREQVSYDQLALLRALMASETAGG